VTSQATKAHALKSIKRSCGGLNGFPNIGPAPLVRDIFMTISFTREL
jgi:hypothetical protein